MWKWSNKMVFLKKHPTVVGMVKKVFKGINETILIVELDNGAKMQLSANDCEMCRRVEVKAPKSLNNN